MNKDIENDTQEYPDRMDCKLLSQTGEMKARLITDEPDLREGYEALLLYIAKGAIGGNDSKPNDPALVAARAAIVKAKGRP